MPSDEEPPDEKNDDLDYVDFDPDDSEGFVSNAGAAGCLKFMRMQERQSSMEARLESIHGPGWRKIGGGILVVLGMAAVIFAILKDDADEPSPEVTTEIISIDTRARLVEAEVNHNPDADRTVVITQSLNAQPEDNQPLVDALTGTDGCASTVVVDTVPNQDVLDQVYESIIDAPEDFDLPPGVFTLGASASALIAFLEALEAGVDQVVLLSPADGPPAAGGINGVEVVVAVGALDSEYAQIAREWAAAGAALYVLPNTPAHGTDLLNGPAGQDVVNGIANIFCDGFESADISVWSESLQ